jgi:enoyl-CoA hydratase/carnithine racemase
VELYLHSPNTPPWRGAQLKHRDNFTLPLPFTELGLVAEGCSSYRFPWIMGTRRASEMLYFGQQMSAQDAEGCGLVSEVFPHATFQQDVWPKLEQYANAKAVIATILSQHKVTATQTLILWMYLHFLYH